LILKALFYHGRKRTQNRLKLLAINTAKLCEKLPLNTINKVYTDQVVRNSSSSAANYWSACRAKSTPDFVNKLKTLEEELDETMFFYEMLAEFNPSCRVDLRQLYQEADELLSIIIASIKTVNNNLTGKAKSKIQNPKSKINERSETK
jgi:four helix bundle protein